MTETEFHEAPAPAGSELPAAPAPDAPAKREMPGTALLEAAAERARRRGRRGRTCAGIFCVLLIVLTAAALICVKWFPLFRISGGSMAPALTEGQIAAASTTGGIEKGDMIAFYSGSQVLVKRVIALAGDWVDMDESGTVYVNSFALDEPYVTEASLGRCDLQFPCQVPEGCVFVLGDHRSVSIDSRSASVGFVSRERVIGRLIYCIWPADRAGKLTAQR